MVVETGGWGASLSANNSNNQRVRNRAPEKEPIIGLSGAFFVPFGTTNEQNLEYLFKERNYGSKELRFS